MKPPKLSDIGQDLPEVIKNKDLLTDDELEAHNVKMDHKQVMSARQREIEQKISKLEVKLGKHELKEGILDKIIATTYNEMENLKPNEFTRRGQKQTALIKQLEALSILHDTILKYEGMIQSYHKLLMDTENNKLNSFIKIQNLKKEEKTVDEGLGAVLMELQESFKAGVVGGSSSTLIDDIASELQDGDY